MLNFLAAERPHRWTWAVPFAIFRAGAGTQEGIGMAFWRQFFTWWNGQTLGTRFYTWRKGVFVGADEFGNKYYSAPSALPASIPERRWVIYSDYAEASAIPPGWHAWMHHRAKDPPAGNYAARQWEKPHQQNLTGTAEAYRPAGSILQPNPQPMAPGYEAWKPE